MKTMDNIRRIDELGRVVLPMYIRRNLGIGNRDRLEIFVDNDKILLKKYENVCILCGNQKELYQFKGKCVCGDCRTGFDEKSRKKKE